MVQHNTGFETIETQPKDRILRNKVNGFESKINGPNIPVPSLAMEAFEDAEFLKEKNENFTIEKPGINKKTFAYFDQYRISSLRLYDT